jgi:hypothetical protein
MGLFQDDAVRIADAVAGTPAHFTHYDPVRKVLVLVVSGDQAELYNDVVGAVKGFPGAAGRRAAVVISEALQEKLAESH